MLPSRYFWELTQPEIAAQLKKNPLVILPAGSVEQHRLDLREIHEALQRGSFASQSATPKCYHSLYGFTSPSPRRRT